MADRPLQTLTVATRAQWRAWLRANQRLPPSAQRNYTGWIDSAKRDETKARRLQEAVRLLARGERLGLK